MVIDIRNSIKPGKAIDVSAFHMMNNTIIYYITLTYRSDSIILAP